VALANEQYAGIEKHHQRFRRDTGDKMQQDRSVAAECYQGNYLAAWRVIKKYKGAGQSCIRGYSGVKICIKINHN